MTSVTVFHYHRVSIRINGRLKNRLYLKAKPPKGWRRRATEYWDTINKSHITRVQLISYDPNYTVTQEEWEHYEATLKLCIEK